jgi:hypothetical protein
MHQRVLRPFVARIGPVRVIRVVVRRRVVLDVLRRFVAGRVARDHLGAFFLVQAHVIDAHDRREAERGEVNIYPVLGDSQVDDHGHGFFGDEALADVAVGSDGAGVEFHHLVVADEPLDVGVFVAAGGVLEGVLLVLHAVVPGVVEHCGCGDGLLEGTAGVSVDEAEAVIRCFHVLVVGVPVNVERCDLEGLRGDGDSHTSPVTTDFNDIDFRSSATSSRCRVIRAFAATRSKTLTRQVAEAIGL